MCDNDTGGWMTGVAERMPATTLNNYVLALIVILVLLFTVPWSLAVLVLCAAAGMIPPAMGISKVCIVGCLIISTTFNQ